MSFQDLLVLLVPFAAVLVACYALSGPVLAWMERRRKRAEQVRSDLNLPRLLPLSVWGGPILCGLLLLGGVWFGVPLLGALAAFLAYRALEHWPEVLRRRRRAAFEEQLPAAMTSVANGLRAGLALPSALDEVASNGRPPISEEFRRLLDEHKHGIPLEQAFENARLRLRHREFDLCVAAFRIGKAQGGDITQVFDRISSAIREIRRLEEAVRTATTQGRSSARFMSFMPAVFLVLLYTMDPPSASLLFTDVLGTVVLSVVILFNVIGHLWIRRLISAQV